MQSPRATSRVRQGRTRDAYGFEVKNEYVALYKQYAPLWEKEETERIARWTSFVEEFAASSGGKPDQAAALDTLEREVAARDDVNAAGSELPDWHHQLRSLVQAGIPMAFRGRLWKACLQVGNKKQAGLYKKLVHKARRKQEPAAELAKPAASRLATPAVPGLSPSISAGSFTVPAAVLAPGEAAEASQGAVRPQPPTAQALETMNSGPEAALSPEAHLPSALAARPPAGTIPVAEAHPDQPPPEVPPDQAMQLNSAVNRALMQNPLTGSTHRSASAQPAKLQAGGSEGGAGWGGSQSGQDWQQQIEKDLHRTFPGHPVMDKTGRSALRRILLAYSVHNPDVGYCQGMNFIAGALLLFMDEEDAFWSLAIIAEDLLPGYFSLIMVAPQVDQLVFKQLVDAQFPTLAAHMEGQGVNVASVSTQWFLCLFVNSLPLETCLRVWDLLFLERCASVLFRIALTLVDIYSLALLSTVDSIDCLSLLQSMAPMSYDSSRLIDTAAIGFAHVTALHLQSLRAVHEAAVQAQFQAPGEIESKLGPLKSNVGPEAPRKSLEESTLRAVKESLPLHAVPPATSPSRSKPAKQLVSLKIATDTSPAGSVAERAGSVGGSSQASIPSRGSDSSLESPASGELAPEWHHTPRWKGTSVFCDHTLRHLSKLSNVGFPQAEAVPNEAAKEPTDAAAPSLPLPAAEAEAGPASQAAARSNAAATAFRIASIHTPNAGVPPEGISAPTMGPESAGRPPEHPTGGSEITPAPQLTESVIREQDAQPSAAAASSQPSARTASLPPLSPRGEVRKTLSGRSRRSSADTGSDVLALGNPPSSLLPPLPVGTDNAPAASAQPPGHADEPAAELMGSSPDDEQPRPSVADEAAPGSGRKAGACGKVLVVAESLEEELFVAEAHRHDAEVSAEGLNALLQELQAKLAEQATLKQERQEKLAALQQRLAEEASVLEASNAQVAALHAQLQMARAQLSLKLSLVAEKDALIASLLQQTGQAPSSFGQGLLRNFARFGRQGRGPAQQPAPRNTHEAARL